MMATIKTGLTVLFIIVCIVLLVLVLIQEGKDAGLGSMTGSNLTGTYWSQNKGRSKKARIIKATTVFAVLFFALAAVLSSRLF
jgi:preprotein translocase subunit SecG